MRWRRLVFLPAYPALQIFLPPRQHSHLRLQTINGTLLVDQHVVQGLNCIVLKSQSCLQIGHATVQFHHSSPKRNSSVSTSFSFRRIARICSSVYGSAGWRPHTGDGQAASSRRRAITCMCSCPTILPSVATFILSAPKVSLIVSAKTVVSCHSAC